MSKLERMTSFVNVVEEHGFAAAARKLGVSTAAISRQINQLEDELKVELIQRTTRKIGLTDIGAQYYQQCKKTLQELLLAEEAIFGSGTEAKGVLTVTSSRYFAENYIVPRLPQFLAENPKLQLKLELAERFPDLQAEGIDLLFGVSMEGPKELVRRRVATMSYILCASPAYLKKFGVPKTPAELSKHHYITHSMRNPANVIRFSQGQEIYVEPILWLNDCDAMIKCALQNMGIVRLHDYMIENEIEKKLLIPILTEYEEPSQFVYLYYQQSRFLQPKIRRFIDFFAPTEPL